MLLPAQHVEQLLLLAGNPQGAHTNSINCLLKGLCAVIQHLVFHQDRKPGVLGWMAFCKQHLGLTWRWEAVISPVNLNEEIHPKMGF